ncbi:6045_t:CDS:2 [Ambispora gerdemannii]|uniref:6045_t:CDS:1 n=1 Tax=Ambispora gerdemannii TaxID=144530 RepID=A0A9N9CWL0_9GLOM|nr:6045_t:CDS:2 [Ambispora gerdemannii]
MAQNQNHQIHYYEDGDIEIIIDNTLFRIHKPYLHNPLSDEYAENFAIQQEQQINCLQIPLPNESADDFAILLSFLYPHIYFQISWENVGILLRLADKYFIPTVTKWCFKFIEENFQHRPLTSLVFADEYLSESIYRESSKLIIDDFLAHEIYKLMFEHLYSAKKIEFDRMFIPPFPRPSKAMIVISDNYKYISQTNIPSLQLTGLQQMVDDFLKDPEPLEMNRDKESTAKYLFINLDTSL